MGSVWFAGAAGVRKIVLGGCGAGICQHHAASCGRVCGIFFVGGTVRRFSVSRIFAVHVDAGRWFLAGSGVVVVRVWSDSLVEWGRTVERAAGGRGDRIFLLLDVAAHGELVVCGGISCGMGLGRD